MPCNALGLEEKEENASAGQQQRKSPAHKRAQATTWNAPTDWIAAAAPTHGGSTRQAPSQGSLFSLARLCVAPGAKPRQGAR